eukprot:COSAG01_NODE_41942_length_445_cov_1.338150_1_plen_44_part_10
MEVLLLFGAGPGREYRECSPEHTSPRVGEIRVAGLVVRISWYTC